MTSVRIDRLLTSPLLGTSPIQIPPRCSKGLYDRLKDSRTRMWLTTLALILPSHVVGVIGEYLLSTRTRIVSIKLSVSGEYEILLESISIQTTKNLTAQTPSGASSQTS